MLVRELLNHIPYVVSVYSERAARWNHNSILSSSFYLCGASHVFCFLLGYIGFSNFLPGPKNLPIGELVDGYVCNPASRSLFMG